MFGAYRLIQSLGWDKSKKDLMANFENIIYKSDEDYDTSIKMHILWGGITTWIYVYTCIPYVVIITPYESAVFVCWSVYNMAAGFSQEY